MKISIYSFYLIIIFFTTDYCVAQTCGSRQDYIPDTNRLSDFPIRYIRVNFHVIADENGQNNFDESIGNEFIKSVYDIANYKLRVKSPMNLPVGNKVLIFLSLPIFISS